MWASPLLINATFKRVSQHTNTVTTAKGKKPHGVISDLGIRNQMQDSQDPANSEAALHYSATYKLLTCDDMTKRGI